MTNAILVLARTLHIGCALLLVAFPYFSLVVLKPVPEADRDEDRFSFGRTATKWMWAALALEAISGGVWFWMVAAQMSERPAWGILASADLRAVLVGTHFGQLWLERAGVGVGLGVALGFAFKGRVGSLGAGWGVLLMSSLLLVTIAGAGHAAAGVSHHALHLFVDALHLLLGAIWPMGLIPLACFLGADGGGRLAVLRRFSAGSGMVVALLAGTGLVNSWLMLNSWEDLFSTNYGRLLLGKVLVVAMMVGLGAVNRWWLLPKMEDEPGRLGVLRKMVWWESGLAAVVLIIVGVMGMTGPGKG